MRINLKKYFFVPFFQDRLVLISLVGGLLLNIILWIILISKFGLASEPMPLHFNVVYGIDLVGQSRRVYQLPAAGLGIFLINLFLGRSIYQVIKLFAYFLIFTSLAIQILLFIASLGLVFLNR